MIQLTHLQLIYITQYSYISLVHRPLALLHHRLDAAIKKSLTRVLLEYKATAIYRLSIASSRTRAASLTSRTTSVIMPGV